jgi:PAS domain S-box-containing protein
LVASLSFLGLVEFLTALVSWATVVALVPIVPRALAMRSPEELEREIAARRLAETELQRTNQELELRIQQRTTELVLANASLQQEREWFRTTLSSIGDAVIATDTEARVTFFNAVAQSLTGWGEQDAKGQPLDVVFRILNEKTGEMAENPAMRALREGVIVGFANRTVLVSRAGHRRPIDDSAAPIRNPAGQVVGAVLVFRDVTERRAAEAINHVLANVTTALVGALHYQSVMRRVADLTVPLLGDMCFFDVVTLEGEIERIGWKHVDPEKANSPTRCAGSCPRRRPNTIPLPAC